MLGFRLNPMLALELGLGQGFHNNVTDAWGDTVDYLSLTQVTVDLKVDPSRAQRAVPAVPSGWCWCVRSR